MNRIMVSPISPSLSEPVHRNSVENVVHNLGNIGRSDTHIKRSDSFISKTRRFINSDKYVYISGFWDKCLVILPILVLILGTITVIWWFVEGMPELKYVSKTGKDMTTMNRYEFYQSKIRLLLSTAALVCSIMQLRVLYKNNDFRDEVQVAPQP